MSAGAKGGGFDADAQCYDRARPRYPERLFDVLCEICALSPDGHILEIGPGTGQATEPLARRGLRITAIELGPNLASIARNNLKDYPKVEIITGNFEDSTFPEASFDLVCAATSIHWIDPTLRFAKPHPLLKTGGHLAIIHTEHISDEAGDAFFLATQPVYRKYSEETVNEDFRLPRVSELSPATLDTERFMPIHFERFPIWVTYTTEEYLDLLRSFSPMLAMAPEVRQRFLDDIGTVIDRDFEGRIEKHVAMTLTIGRVRA